MSPLQKADKENVEVYEGFFSEMGRCPTTHLCLKSIISGDRKCHYHKNLVYLIAANSFFNPLHLMNFSMCVDRISIELSIFVFQGVTDRNF